MTGTLAKRYAAANHRVRKVLAAQAETIGAFRFRDLGRTGIRIEYGKPDYDGEFPAAILPRAIVQAMQTMSFDDRDRVLRWLGLGDRALWLDRPTFADELRKAIRAVRGGRTSLGDAAWLAKQIGVPDMTAGRYLHGATIPGPGFAARVAALFGWGEAKTAQLIHAARLQREAEKNR